MFTTSKRTIRTTIICSTLLLTALLIGLAQWRGVKPAAAAALTGASPSALMQSSWMNNQAAVNVIGQPNFTSNSSGTSATTLNRPAGVAIDSITGKVFVAEYSNHRVLRYSSAVAQATGQAAEAVLGQPNFISNTPALSQSGMDTPIGIFVDGGGRLWVADAGNGRALRFDNAATKANGANADGELGQQDFTTYVSDHTAGRMSSPNGVFVDGAGRLWVSDLSNHRVLRFDNAAAKANGADADGVLGQLNFTNNAPSTSQSRMNNPLRLFVDVVGRLWVADGSNHRVLRFDNAAAKANGANADGVLGQPDFTTNASTTTQSGMQNPHAVFGDPEGRLYVGDSDNNRILIFNNAAFLGNGANADNVLGQPDFTSGSVNNGGVSATSFSFPTHAFFDNASYSLFVADEFNNRVKRYTIMPPAGGPCASPQFLPVANFPAGTNPRDAAAGDFNLDGKQDLAIANAQVATITILFGNGNGGFPTSATVSAGDSPYGIAVGDFDSDGKLDIATSNFPDATVSVLLGNGNGTFKPVVNYGIGSTSGQGYGITVGDFNRDSKPDLGVVGPFGVTILLGNGDGTFLIGNTYGAGTDRLVAGDFNRDGNQDIAVSNQGLNNVSILLGNGNGTFQPAGNYGLGTGQTPIGIVLGDFNADGKLDLATSNYVSNSIAVLLGNGNGTFQTAVNYPVPNTSYYLGIGDLNADGVLDLAAPRNDSSGGIGVLLGNGDGTFQASVKFNLPAGTDFVTVSDLNGDRKPDLIAIPVGTNNITTLLNTCACTPPDVTPTAPAQVCASSPGNTVSIPDAGAGASYTWTNYGFNGTITSATNTPSITFTAGAAGVMGTMTLGVTVTNAGGCTASKLIYIPINPLPTLGNYPAAGTINVGTGTTVMPNAPPSQSPTISSITASAPGFTGSFSVNPVTGVVTVSNAAPAGNYTVTVKATDLCGAMATKTFSLTVNGPPTIAGKTVALQAGATATNVAIATVNDDLTPRHNLVVTVVPPLPLGITVTAISVNPAGNVTATVAADCLAGTGNNNVTLRVTDGNGLTAQATLVVNVTPFYSYAGGIADNFAPPAEAASRRTALNNLLPFSSWKNFDATTLSRSVGHSFTSLPANIIKAELEVRMKPAGAASANDTIRLGLTPPSTFAYASAITGLPGTGGTWVSNLPVTFTLDLSNLPGGGNILSKVAAERLLDVVIGADTTVDYLKLRVWTCPPGVIVGGTPTARIGQSSITINPDGSQTLSGLNAPGLHGYELSLGQADGASVTLRYDSDLRVNGDSIGVQHNGPPTDGGDEQVLVTATFAGNGTNVLYNVNFNVGAAQSLYELRNGTGAVVRTFVAPNNSALTFVTGGSPYTTAAKTFYDSRSNSAKATIAAPVTVLDPGNITTPGVTDISVTALLPTTTIAFVSSTSVQAHLTGGTLVTINQGVVLFGNEFLTAHPQLPSETQTATFALAGGALTVANIGSSGMDGVVLLLRATHGETSREQISIEPTTIQANVNASPAGAFMQGSATATLNGTPNQSLGMLRSTKTSTLLPPAFTGALKQALSTPFAITSDIYTVTADFGAISSATQRVQVYNNGIPVADIPGHTGAVGTTSAWPIGFGQRIVANGGNRPNSKLVVGLPGFIASYPASTVININGTDYTGDELRVTAEGSNVTIDSLDSFSLTAADIPEFTITDAQVTPSDNPPTIAAVAVTRQAGSPSASATIANVNDTEDAKNTLVVKVNNATTATVNGVTVSGLSVDSAGLVMANVVAACGATNASFALTVIDSGGSTVSTGLDVAVVANDLPMLAYNATQTVAAGGATTINPTFGPTDNGSVTGIAVQSPGTFTGTLTVDNTTGVVSVSNAKPGGSHTITIRVTDNCGATKDTSFTLTVTCPPITVTPPTLPNGIVGASYGTQTLSASGGSAPYAFTLDSGTLPDGIMLSGIALTGTPTATGVFNFTIKATDNNGCVGMQSYTVVISGTGLQFYPLAVPVRLVDTRTGQTACTTPGAPITGGTALTQVSRGTCGIPATAKAVTGNVTAVLPAANGFLTIYPSDAISQPTAANTNFIAGDVLNNVFTVGLGAADGAMKIFASSTADVVVDITGYFAPPGAGGLYFHKLPRPIRLLETRTGQPTGCFMPGTPLAANSETAQQGTTTCDGVTVPATAKALVGNATTVFPAANGFVTLYPADAASRPLAASGNYRSGTVLNSPFTVGLSPSGQFKIYTVAQTNLVIDVLGYYSADAQDVNGIGLLFTPLTPARLVDTRTGQAACFMPNAPLTGGVESLQGASGVCTIANTAQAIVGNATTVQPTANGFLTFWPSDAASRPLAATSNFQSGRNFNRYYTVGLGVDGAFKMYAAATTNLVIDVSGYFAP